MPTNKLVDLGDVAQLVETGLNLLSQRLYKGYNDPVTDDEIYTPRTTDKEIVFDITDNMDDYETLCTTANSDGDQVRPTPCLLQKIDTDVVADQNIGIYTESYIILFYGFYDEYENVKKILDTYTIQEKGGYQSYEGWLIEKSVGTVDYTGKLDSNDGLAEDRISGDIIFTYTYIDGGIHSSQVITKFDTKGVPFDTVNIGKEKLPLSGVYEDSETKESLNQAMFTTYYFSGTLIGSNTKMVEIARDIREDDYLNKVYSLNINDGIIETTTPVLLINGNYLSSKPGIVTIDALFVKAKVGIL